MQYRGDLIAPALFDEFDDLEEMVEELLLDNDAVVFEGLMKSKHNVELISPEDLVWVDSCLVTEPELPMESWASVKEALLDSITAFATSYEENNTAAIVEDEVGSDEKMGLDEKPAIVNDQRDSAHVRTKANATEADHDSVDDGGVKIVPTIKDFIARESIFKVWDLREEEDNDLIPELRRSVGVVEEEEDWFITELKIAVAESVIRDKQRMPFDEASIAEDGKLDDLISSMGDLSLNPLS